VDFAAYGDNFREALACLEDHGVSVTEGHDFEASGLADAVLLMGVIEHILHTPRPVLQKTIKALRPGGIIVVETPNIAYSYKRNRLAQGLSPCRTGGSSMRRKSLLPGITVNLPRMNWSGCWSEKKLNLWILTCIIFLT
jgi:SAM-dependent methyltransferase